MERRTFVLMALGAAGSLPLPAQKRSVTVEPFDYSTVMTSVQAIFGTHVDIGRGIAAMMVRRVQQDGKFTVVERNKVASVLREQDFGASGRVKRGTQARLGQIRGADLTLMGDIVVFGRDDRRVGAAGGAIVNGTGGAAGGRHQTGKAVVVLNYRLVDNESSEILATGEARGESKRSGGGFGAALLTGGVFAGGVVDMTSSNFAQTIIGEATMAAVDGLAAQLSGQASGVPARSVEVEAKVADVNGNSVIINAGANSGVQTGDRFQVMRVSKEIKDPATGEVLDVLTEPVGAVTIEQVRDRIAIGTFSGSGAPRVGDTVRK